MKHLFERPGNRNSAAATIAPARPDSSTIRSCMKAIPLVALILFYAVQAQATTLLKKSLNDLLAESDGIVVGTVSEMKSRYDKKKEIQTLVTLTELQVVHGHYNAPSLVLQLQGGEIEGDVLEIHGSPKFESKDRVVVFIKDNGRELVPFVGWTQGVFRVSRDAKGNDRVKDHEGNNVLAVAGADLVKEQINLPEAVIVDGSGQPTLKGAGAGTTDDGSRSELVSQSKKSSKGDAMTLREFLSTIGSKLKDQGLKGKSIASVSAETPVDAGLAHDGDAAPPQSAR